MMIVKVIAFILGGLAIAATLLSLLPLRYWWVRDFDFPRVQIVFLILFILPVYLFSITSVTAVDILFCSVLLICMGYQLFRIYPYTPAAPKQVAWSRSNDKNIQFSLLIANVLMGNRRSGDFFKLIRTVDPDLILVVEIDGWWSLQLKSLNQSYPYSIVYPLDNTYGMALYSRLELTQSRINFLIQDDVPSIYTRFALPAGRKIDLYGLHPQPPSPTEHYRSTERDAELLVVADAVKDVTAPIVVAGDLNDVAWSRTNHLFQSISRLLDPRIGRGTYGTFPADFPLLRWPLDHVFHSHQFRLLEMRTLARFGSDHLPVFIRLSYEPAAADANEEPESADREDRQEARETISEAKRDN